MTWPYVLAINAIGIIGMGTWYLRKLERDDEFFAAYRPGFAKWEESGQAIGLRPGWATKWVIFSTVLWWPGLLIVGLLWSLGLGKGRS